ncbi:diadenylate cyclase CdaA [Humisphaera borealis]|uniref:Diadenylate cyclase n=1 Tax=Humisphaera borealis TaxID=2807512 RepID=A0A7M2X1L3_9BACT|nr:diadenylate cyclase CdaA [Humisphaera borealis]QOV91647.1 TIGR00159 family protein [Humisphaera borealis]
MIASLFNLQDFFRSLRNYEWWRVAIELLLIGVVVYWVVGFLRGTRGARMLRGIAFVLITLYLIVGLLADQAGLERLKFLYEKFLLGASFAIVIAFQPELRRALIRLGEQLPIIRGRSERFSEDIEALVEAATFLSRRKIGAVIAIERDTPIVPNADENGTMIDAKLTADLLNTIFWPNSPLHDLGVIIAGGRVAFAGVQFPMAESGELERELGARHRAAVGMSQDSDAVVVVVSEETGDISIAERGQLIRKLMPDGLRGLLTELLGRGTQGGFFRKAP